MSNERILDLGIGKGGSYIDLDDPKQTFRFGVDQNRKRLGRLRQNHLEVSLCESNLKGPITPTLPYASGSFDSVELRFPHDELLFWLTDETQNLWGEFKRVLRPEGSVVVIFDVPPDGKRTISVESVGQVLEVQDPENHIWRQAVDSGFRVEIDPFTKQQAYDMGSDYGKRVANWIKRTDNKHQAYILRANL